MKADSDPLALLLASFRRDGNAEAMERLVAATRRKLMAVARRIGSPQDAEDSVQAAYHALLARADVPEAPILPWLLTTVVRIAYRRKAVALRDVGIADRLARRESPGTPLERAASTEEAALIRREVSSLPAKYRNALVLYYLDGLSVAETARLLEVPASTVTTRLQRGRVLLRSRLGAVLGGILFVPWFVLDLSKAWGAVALGGIVKTKTAAIVAGVALATGSLGVVVGTTVLADDAPTRTSGGERHRAAELVAKVRERDAEIERLREQLREAPPPAKGAGADRPNSGSQPKKNAKPSSERAVSLGFGGPAQFDPKRAKAAAEKLGVSKESLEIAVRAYKAIHNKADPTVLRDAIAALTDLGRERAQAAAAVIRGISVGPLTSSGLAKFMQAAHVPGEEGVFIDILKDDVTNAATKQEIVRNMDSMDADTIRDYLVGRLRLEEDKYWFTTIGSTLGRLKETRAIPVFREKLWDNDWAPFHIYMLIALGEMGGREAEATLVDYLRRENGAKYYAVYGLRKINPNLARREAQAILAAGARRLAKDHVEKLRAIAGG